MTIMRHRFFVLPPLSSVLVLAVAVATASAVTPITPGGVFRAGQTASLPVGATDDVWQVVDDADYPEEAVELASGTVAQGETLTLPHKALNGRLGAFLLRSWSHGGTTTNKTRFAFIPPCDVRPVRWVGTNSQYNDKCWGYADEAITDGLLDLAAEAGIGIFRDGAKWSDCEDEQGVYFMPDEFEHFVDALVARGMSLDYLLVFRNRSVYPDNPVGAQPASVFANWAAWTANHFAGRVDTYDIYNEPWNFYYWDWYTNEVAHVTAKTDPGFLRHFANFTRTVDDALHAVDPNLRVGVGGGPDSRTILSVLVTNGVARPRNFVSIHPYGGGSVLYPEKATWLKDGFAELRGLLAANDAEGADIAITEDGWSNYRPGEDMDDGRQANYSEQAARIVRMYLVANAANAEFTCQFCFKDVDHNRSTRTYNYGLLDYWGHPKPSYAAVAAMTRFIGDSGFTAELSADQASYRIQRFDRADGVTNFVAWSVEGDRTVTISQDVRSALRGAVAYDLYGNKLATSPRNGQKLSLTEAPVYFVKGSSESGGGDSPWGPPWAIAATSEPMTIYANAAESLLWHTTPFGGTTVRWDKPDGATSATLTVTGDGYSRTYANLAGESREIALPGGAATTDGEDVVTLTLAFDNGTVRTAYLGAVTGYGTGGTAASPAPKNSAAPSWAKFRDRAVVAIPFGATALTVNGEPLPGLDGSAGWRSIHRMRGVADYDLAMTVEGEAEPLLTTLSAKAYNTLLILQ